MRWEQGQRRDLRRLAIGRRIPQQTRQHAKASSAAVVHEQRAAVSFSRCRDPQRRAGRCVVVVIPTDVQGRAGI